MELNLERMRAALREAADVATNALEHQPEATGECWRHLSAAVGKVHQATRLGWAKLVKFDKADRKDETIAGNAAAMREALVKVSRWLEGMLKFCHRHRVGDVVRHRRGVGEVLQVPVFGAFYVLDLVRDAIATPPRNCDVGTAEEQIVRHKKHCDSIVCPYVHSSRICFSKWAQMPYEAEESEETKPCKH